MAVNKCYQNSSEHDLLAKQWLSYTQVVGDISHGHFQNRFILWLFNLTQQTSLRTLSPGLGNVHLLCDYGIVLHMLQKSFGAL